jgi:hypothetical protein
MANVDVWSLSVSVTGLVPGSTYVTPSYGDGGAPRGGDVG